MFFKQKLYVVLAKSASVSLPKNVDGGNVPSDISGDISSDVATRVGDAGDAGNSPDSTKVNRAGESEDKPLDYDDIMANHVFIKQGFSIWAYVFNIFWLLYNKIWDAALFVAVLYCFLGVLLKFEIIDIISLRIIFSFGIRLWLGFDGANLKEDAYLKKGFQTVDIVSARTTEEAQRVFLTKILQEKQHNETLEAKTNSNTTLDLISDNPYNFYQK